MEQKNRASRIKKMLGPGWRAEIAKQAHVSEATVSRMVNKVDTSHPNWKYVSNMLKEKLQNEELVKIATDEKI